MKDTIKKITIIGTATAGILFFVCGVLMLATALSYYSALSEASATSTADIIRDVIGACGLYFGFSFVLLGICGATASGFDIPSEE